LRKVSEYEAHAEECRRLAGRMNDPTHKMQLEQMAHAWAMLARERAKKLLKSAILNDGASLEAGAAPLTARPEEAGSS